MPRTRLLLTLSLGLALVVTVGCGEPSLKTEPVKGLVTLDGEPVAEAIVAFNPVDNSSGAVPANGMTDENGIYTITAVAANAKHGAGTTPGKYYVSVTKNSVEVPLSEEEAEEQGVPYKPLKPGQNPDITFLVPPQYNQFTTSGLVVEVVEGENDIPLELTK